MKLTQDLITMFAKITNDDKKDNKETTVYGTTVIQNGSRYVRIDGSDILTPVQSTAVIRSGARVTVMLKDHQAIVTGNLSDPSASSEDLINVDEQFGSLNEKVDKKEFELTINEILSTITDLTSRIEKLEQPDTNQ